MRPSDGWAHRRWSDPAARGRRRCRARRRSPKRRPPIRTPRRRSRARGDRRLHAAQRLRACLFVAQRVRAPHRDPGTEGRTVRGRRHVRKGRRLRARGRRGEGRARSCGRAQQGHRQSRARAEERARARRVRSRVVHAVPGRCIEGQPQDPLRRHESRPQVPSALADGRASAVSGGGERSENCEGCRQRPVLPEGIHDRVERLGCRCAEGEQRHGDAIAGRAERGAGDPRRAGEGHARCAARGPLR